MIVNNCKIGNYNFGSCTLLVEEKGLFFQKFDLSSSFLFSIAEFKIVIYKEELNKVEIILKNNSIISMNAPKHKLEVLGKYLNSKKEGIFIKSKPTKEEIYKRNKDIFIIISFAVTVLIFSFYLALVRVSNIEEEWSNNNKHSLDNNHNYSIPKDFYFQKANYFGAYDKSDLDLLVKLLVDKDREAINDNLINTGKIFIIEAGKKVYFVEGGGLLDGMIKVRPEGETTEYWVLMEALNNN